MFSQGVCLFTPDGPRSCKDYVLESRNRVREALSVRPRPKRAFGGIHYDMTSIFLDRGDERRVMLWKGSAG
jgi:hypothetical protein